MSAKAARQRRSAKWMHARGWSHETPSNGLRRRLHSLATDHRPWWDWGHRLMTLTGDGASGSWAEPEPPTWWYRIGAPTHQWRTGYPRHPMSTIQVVTDYAEFRALTAGLDEDAMYEWKAFCVDQDGELRLGKQYWGGPFYGLTRWETALLRRYLRHWHRHDWFGLRSWLWQQGLHAAVHAKKPGTCQAVPPRGQGGYDHWYCRLPRRHDGFHRFNNYTWGEVGGEEIGALYNPAESSR